MWTWRQPNGWIMDGLSLKNQLFQIIVAASLKKSGIDPSQKSGIDPSQNPAKIFKTTVYQN